MLYVVGEEMNKEKIINLVEEFINEEADTVMLDTEEAKSSVDEFFINTAVRLIKTYSKYRDGICHEHDMLVSLRNFLLVYETEMRVESIDIAKNNKFGIYKNNYSNKYYAAYSLPESIRGEKFIRESFINQSTQSPKNESRYQLRTNGYIRNLSGFEKFKSIEQKLCVYGALNTPAGYTTLISMPTGGGKSLVTQTLGYEKDGLSIVVVPTVSLALDQERAAKNNIKIAKNGEIFCYYSASPNFKEIVEAIKGHKAKLLFISPEALIKNEQFKQLIADANETGYIKNLIIDEAHIVVAWGDFFRIDYQCLGPWRRELLKTNPALRSFLLSATYRDDVVSTLKYMFSKDDRWLEIRCDSLRKEPRYILQKTNGFYEKKNKVIELVNLLPRPTILYVNSPYYAKKWKEYLEKEGYSNIYTFTGETKSVERRELIDNWANNEFDLMIATSAFGVGVDKPDVRTVMHLYVPGTPDFYYQELGRGGRDGLPCLSVMCIENKDIDEGARHVTKVLTKDTFWGRWWSMYTNPENQWQGGLIAIMASTKPNYNKINFFEEGNETDEKWNINVLLLLNRYHQIEIIGLDLDDKNRYIFTIKILNDILTEKTNEAQLFFESIRDKEAAKAQEAFMLIRNSIERADKLCWSGMYYETYPLVSEYCAGCSCHEDTVADELRRFPLLVDVKGPEKKISNKVKEFFSDTYEALIINGDSNIDLIKQYMPDIVVCNETIENENLTSPYTNYLNYAEFRDLQMHDNGFFVSGLVMAIYGKNAVDARKQYQIVRKYVRNGKYVIHVASSDFVVSTVTGKTLFDYVGGSVIS